MVPKIAARGASFKGAGQYYLHDKGADTNARVEFTLTQNLPTDDPELALKIMAHTAMRQQQLKVASGQVKTGRKLTKPVYTYSLSWSPDQEPTKDQMIEAAQETIKRLGLEGHEILMVAHNDTAHPHIHVIANRVHPETGLAATLSNDRLVLSRWAEEYERKHGKILCEQRVENNARRAAGEFVKYKSGIDAAAIHRARKARVDREFKKRQAQKDLLEAAQKGERDFLYDQKEQKITAARAEIREQNRPKWAALFKRQEKEKATLEKQLSSSLRRLTLKAEDRSVRRLALDTEHQKQREALQKSNGRKVKNAIDKINKLYKKDLQKLKNMQWEQRQALAEQHSRESQAAARAIAAGSDIKDYQNASKAGAQKTPRAPDKPSPAPQKKRALADARDEKIEQRLRAIKEQNRPKWAALFKRQRAELKTFENAQQAALPRLFYHLRHGKQEAGGRFAGAVKALIGGEFDRKVLEQRHEDERRTLARAVRRERRAATQYEEKTYQRDLARLEKELTAEAAAYEKAVAEGQGGRAPEKKAVRGTEKTGQDFEARVRAKLKQAKKREEERKRKRGRDDGGRERDE
jgi:hypothetical protein